MDVASVTLELVFGGWVFFLGASIGSFANVLAYRWPRGMPIGASVSRCPRCHRAIRFSDNVPGVSWFLLGGKCRYCQWPIPARYVVVELLFGSMFFLLYLADIRLVSAGPRFAGRLDELLNPLSMLTFAHHAFLASTLAVAALMRLDSAKPGRIFWLSAVAMGCVAAAAVPTLYSASTADLMEGMEPPLASRLLGVVMAISGGVLGWLMSLCQRDSHHADPSWIAAGVFLGPAGLAIVSVLMPPCRLMLKWLIQMEPSAFRSSLSTLAAVIVTVLTSSYWTTALETAGSFKVAWIAGFLAVGAALAARGR